LSIHLREAVVLRFEQKRSSYIMAPQNNNQQLPADCSVSSVDIFVPCLLVGHGRVHGQETAQNLQRDV
jgi:hypothetical protein